MTKTDGVPLFVEELTKAVLIGHAGAIRAIAGCWPAGSPPLAIPATAA